MSKGGFRKAAIGGLIVLWMANTANPGTAEKVVQSGSDTVTPIVDQTGVLVNESVIPAAGDTLSAAKDGLAQTNLLGPSQPPAWAEPEAPGE